MCCGQDGQWMRPIFIVQFLYLDDQVGYFGSTIED